MESKAGDVWPKCIGLERESLPGHTNPWKGWMKKDGKVTHCPHEKENGAPTKCEIGQTRYLVKSRSDVLDDPDEKAAVHPCYSCEHCRRVTGFYHGKKEKDKCNFRIKNYKTWGDRNGEGCVSVEGGGGVGGGGCGGGGGGSGGGGGGGGVGGGGGGGVGGGGGGGRGGGGGGGCGGGGGGGG